MCLWMNFNRTKIVLLTLVVLTVIWIFLIGSPKVSSNFYKDDVTESEPVVPLHSDYKQSVIWNSNRIRNNSRTHIPKQYNSIAQSESNSSSKVLKIYRIPKGLPQQRTRPRNASNKENIYQIPKFTDYVNKANVTYPLTLRSEYLMSNNDICSGNTVITVLVMVHTAIEHVDRRQNIRASYGSRDLFLPMEVRTVFLLGIPNDPSRVNMINEENEEHKDIVQGNFLDTYHNLTHKAVMGLRWVTENCQNAKHVVKIDDDVVFDMWRFLYQFPKNSSGNSLWCNIFKHERVQRIEKWAVAIDEFKGQAYYPWPYCAGMLVILNTEVIPKLFKAAFESPFFWIDDVYVYGILRSKVKEISMRNFPRGFYASFVGEYCHVLNSCNILALSVRTNKFNETWNMIMDRAKRIN